MSAVDDFLGTLGAKVVVDENGVETVVVDQGAPAPTTLEQAEGLASKWRQVAMGYKDQLDIALRRIEELTSSPPG